MMRRFLLVLALVAVLSASFAAPVPLANAQGLPAGLSEPFAGPVSPGLCRVKTDMEIPWLYSLPVNFHSRTRLPQFAKIPGGITPATVRLQGGRGNVQLTPAWLDYIERINNRNPVVIKYLFHADSGWQNSDIYGRVEQLVFENQRVKVLRVSGNRAYIETFFINLNQPSSSSTNDPRVQLFTIVTRDDKIIGTPKGNAYIAIMARAGESLYIGTQYLDCPSRLPMSVTVRTAPNSLNIRSAPLVADNRIGSYPSGTVIQVLETRTDGSGNVWGRTSAGWVALRYNGALLTDWQVQ